jgi:hypothetical protein
VGLGTETSEGPLGAMLNGSKIVDEGALSTLEIRTNTTNALRAPSGIMSVGAEIARALHIGRADGSYTSEKSLSLGEDLA